MKKLIFVFVALSAVGLGACSESMEAFTPDSMDATENPVVSEAKLEALFDLAEKTGDAYALYDASTGTTDIMDAEAYELADAMADIIVRDEKDGVRKAPEGSGWIYAGSGSTKANALKMSRTLMQKIPAGMDFEIHVEYDETGKVWKVWYRLIKK